MINVYSQSDNELGRLLSNFAHTPFYGSDRKFASVEGWWYWFTTGKQHDHLCGLYGFKAKQEGKKYKRIKEVTRPILKAVYLAKLEHNPRIKNMLLSYDGEFEHYYVFNGKKVSADKHLWTATLWQEVRDDLRGVTNDEV